MPEFDKEEYQIEIWLHFPRKIKNFRQGKPVILDKIQVVDHDHLFRGWFWIWQYICFRLEKFIAETLAGVMGNVNDW